MKKLALATLAVAATGATFAAAAPMMTMSNVNPWYVGVGVNYSANITDKVTGTVTNNNDTVNYTAKLNSRNVGGNVFAGYQYNKFLGAEFGGSFQGNNKYKVTDNTNGGYTYATVKNQWNLHLVGNAYLPVADWFAPYAFGGVSYINAKVNALNTPVAENATIGSFGFIYGAGVQFNINQFGVRAYYTRLDPTDGAANNATLPIAKDYISLDVLYRFGA